MGVTDESFRPAFRWKCFGHSVAVVALIAASTHAMAAQAQTGPTAPPQPSGRPNIILIVGDDLGYGDIGAYGQKKIDTPYLDQLAAEGVRFTDHYAGAPVCAPSRATLLTGRSTAHVQIRGNFELGDFADEGERGQMPLAANTPTLPGLLRSAGYTTALIGKWGLGVSNTEGEPSRHGFNYSFGILDQKQAHNYYPTHLWENGARVPLRNPFFIPHVEPKDPSKAADAYGRFQGADYGPDRLIQKAEQFIERHDSRTPFFLYYASPLPHPALQIPAPLAARYKGRWRETSLDRTDYTPHPTPRAARAAMITRLDEEVGRIRAALARSGQAENTIILFTSDNGPTLEGGSDLEFFNAAGGLRGTKRDLYEGGIRVPLIAHWSGHIKPGTVAATVSANYDLLPTLAEIAGVTVPFPIDGASMLPALEGKPQAQTKPLYWEFHEKPAQAARDGRWKAVRHQPRGFDPAQPIELYDLSVDPSETRDTARSHPETVAKMKLILDARAPSPIEGFNFDTDTDELSQQRPPNVLIIVADDLGFADVGFNDAPFPTPNIDRIARTGMALDRFYNSPLCSPSRAGMLTGRYPHRYGIMGDTITPGSDFGLDSNEQTIAQVLGGAGYTRRSFIGKWHLGHRSPAFHPMSFGFTSFYGHYNGAIDYFTHEREGQVDWHRDRTPSKDKGYATDLLTDEAVRTIRTPAPDGAPWMMWLAYNAPHGPLQATEEDLAAVGFDPSKPRFSAGTNKGEAKSYGEAGRGNTRRQTQIAMIRGMDRGIGKILEALAETKQLDNTFILFTSDNGGPKGISNNGPLRGSKFLHYEGGVRVAAALSWPAGLKSRAQADIGPISYVDLLPTIAQITGARLDRPVDGKDVSEALLTGNRLASERALFMGEDYRVPAATNERGPTDPESLRGRTASVIVGKWKLVGEELYDLEADPYEKSNVAARYPDVVASLKKQADEFASQRRVPRERMNATHLPPIPLWEIKNATEGQSGSSTK